MKKNYLIIIALILCLGAFVAYKLSRPEVLPILDSQVSMVTPTIKDIKNNTYVIEGAEISLVDGREQREIISDSDLKLVTQYFGNEVMADFNDDGFEDAVFLLTQDSGGSGSFFYVALTMGSKDGYVGSNTIFLGDRVAPQTTEYRDGEIIVNYLDRDASDSFATSPSVGVSRYFTIEDGELVEILK